MKTQHAIETEFGLVYVDEAEFNDVKARVNGEYGADHTKSPDGNPWIWIEDEQKHYPPNSPRLILGSARETRPVQLEEPKSAFERELRRLLAAGETAAALKHVDEWKARGYDI